jgi:hypothetical protein
METPPPTWPLPRAHDSTPRTSAEERVLQHVRHGASVAVFALLRASQAVGSFAYVPALWDERVVPLCAYGAPVVSFWWDGSVPAGVAPAFTAVAEMARAILEGLRLDAHEVVIAVALLESLVVRHGNVVQPYSVRPVLLAVCILALKLTRDADVSTACCVRRVEARFTALTPLLGARIERQLLEYLNWRVPNDPAVYERHTLALLAQGAPPDTVPPPAVDIFWLSE